MTISMMEHRAGTVQPRCNKCGKDVFCRDLSSMQRLYVQPDRGIEVMPLDLGNDLVGHGLRQNDFTCTACLLESNQATVP